MVNSKYIREALAFQDLSEEEKQRRGILGRLYGPCASIIAPTRNGRMYSDELWEKVFNENEIVKEMLENGGCPLELDHPVDREETCSEKIAAMLPEAPKRDKDGHLICYIDLIDTPCGKIAYQLAKYGFKLGISSRGTGDLRQEADGSESVDPDTYDFTTFDLVLLPAVKDARLCMCESLDKNINNFKKAITESYAIASSEDKKIMEDTLKDLNINLEKDDVLPGGTPKDITDIPESTDEPTDVLVESDETEEEAEVAVEETSAPEMTINELIDQLKDYDKDLSVEFKPIVIEDKEYAINGMDFDNSEDGKLVVNIDYSPVMEDNIDGKEEIESEEAVDEQPTEEPEETEESADDAGDAEFIEGLKEVVRQKDSLEKEVKDLKSEKAVSDAEVGKLKEELDRYKSAFARTSEIATNAKKYESEIKSLTEQLNAKNLKIQKLESVKANTETLTESRDANAAKVKALTEKLSAANKKLTETEANLTEQLEAVKKQVNSRTEVARKYKAKFTEAMNRYVASKASMLGVRPAEILNRLDENFTIDDVDSVCDNMLNESVNISRLPYGLTNTSKVRINEAKPAQTKRSLDDGYEIDDDLLILAGLK